MKILKGVEGVSICQLTQQDVVRHVMVQRIIELRPIRGEAQMRKTHYIPITADATRAANDANCALIRRAIRTALAAEGLTAPCEVDVLLTDDDGIHEINREMRQVDRPTDVLSFPEFELAPGQLPGPEDADPGTGLIPLGDMVLSMERVSAQAREYGHSKRRELSYLVTHSVLHLLGYDHLDEGAYEGTDAGQRGGHHGPAGSGAVRKAARKPRKAAAG